ncbi:MAG: AraC family transcriptional regulator ligand-binding domain-containing protein [Ilumatobacteraceae bacterium]|nr:AraC family transcriptional regulator ligand-binding domain-containing protein [Ilumatobacteraceae bacterium]
MIDVADERHDRNELLESVGLSSDPAGVDWVGDSIDEETYYGLLERIAGTDDLGFPFRYAQALHPDDLGALGLAIKTAPTLRAALERLARYVLVLSDTLRYELVDERDGAAFVLVGRSHHRRGAAIANECAVAAVTSVLRIVGGITLEPTLVEFHHAAPSTDRHHVEFFGSPVRFEAAVNGIHVSEEHLARRALLADDGLSTYLLSRLDDLTARKARRSIVDDVRAAIADSLPDGQPSKSQIARRLAISERTLHRQLADHDESFQAIATRARRDAAESLLTTTSHSIADVAFLTGFADQSAFTRAFKRWTGTTPAAFRDRTL